MVAFRSAYRKKEARRSSDDQKIINFLDRFDDGAPKAIALVSGLQLSVKGSSNDGAYPRVTLSALVSVLENLYAGEDEVSFILRTAQAGFTTGPDGGSVPLFASA